MRTLTAIVAAATLFTMSACGPDAVKSSPAEDPSIEYTSMEMPGPKATGLMTLEGVIVKVYPSTISYLGKVQPTYGLCEAVRSSGSHPFEYVILQTSNKTHTLIFPFTQAILEGDATVTFRPTGGPIDGDRFVQTFLGKDFNAEYPVKINTEGVITANGISYK